MEKGQTNQAGIDIAVVAEAYSFDAVSQLGYLAAKTSTIELASGVFPIYIRTPSLLRRSRTPPRTRAAAARPASAARG